MCLFVGALFFDVFWYFWHSWTPKRFQDCSRLRFDGDIEILNEALPIAYSRRDGWAEVQQAERSKGSEKKSVEKMAENEVDRILIFLDPAQEIPEGAYDPQLQ